MVFKIVFLLVHKIMLSAHCLVFKAAPKLLRSMRATIS
jgi:hypothetical protein